MPTGGWESGYGKQDPAGGDLMRRRGGHRSAVRGGLGRRGDDPGCPSLDLADQPASDEDLGKESGSAVQSVAGNNSSGLLLLPPTGQAVGTAPSFDSAGSTTISTSNSLTAISTLSATIDSNGFQN